MTAVHSSIPGVAAQVVQNPEDADFILAHGTEAIGQRNGAAPQAASMQQINALLQSCAEQQVAPPMVVANPDVVTVSGPDLVPMPGTLAQYYASLAGKVCSTPCFSAQHEAVHKPALHV